MERQAGNHEWCLKRNCALTPVQFASAWIVLSLALLAVGIFFLLQGTAYVLSFSLMEVVALAVAFIAYARHATDREHVALIEGSLLVEQIDAGKLTKICLVPAWTRVIVPVHQRELIKIECGRTKIQIGRHLSLEKRQQFAKELIWQMRSALQ